MGEIYASAKGPGFYYSCDFCMMAGPLRPTYAEAELDNIEHNTIHRN